MLKRYLSFLLLVGDMLALMLFVYLGQREHELIDPQNPLLGMLLTTSAFVLPWVVAGGLLGAYPRDTQWTPRALLTHSLNTWLVAAPLALVLRAFALGRDVIPTIFVVVAIFLGGAFILGWRLAFTLIWNLLTHAERKPA